MAGHIICPTTPQNLTIGVKSPRPWSDKNESTGEETVAIRCLVILALSALAGLDSMAQIETPLVRPQISRQTSAAPKLSVLPRRGESFKSYLYRLLPKESTNRTQIEKYARDQGVQWAPQKIVDDGHGQFAVHWQLDFANDHEGGATFVDQVKLVSLLSGEFVINHQPFHIRPLSGVLRDLEIVEGLLTPPPSSTTADLWMPRSLRQETWPREKGAVHLLTLIYSIYLAQPTARCESAKQALSHAMIGADAELREIPRCDQNGIEVVVREGLGGPWLRLNWYGHDRESMSVEELSEAGAVGRRIHYAFGDLGLRQLTVTHVNGRQEVYSTEFGRPKTVSKQMLMEFRRRYVLIERIRNSGAEWGFTCNTGCHDEIEVALRARPPTQYSRQQKRPTSPRRSPSSEKN